MQTLPLALALAVTTSLVTSGLAADRSRPHLETRHGVRQLVVDDQPFLVLGGELRNSSSSSREYMKSVWPRLAEKKLNTVLAAISWELIEPEEGRFDFSSVDSLLEDARVHQMRVVFLWFASWKNGLSSYPPMWVKTNYHKFPLVKNSEGQTKDILSTFGEATVKADAKAFAALMRHLRQVDGKEHTVLMMQVENEVGMRDDSRDRSTAANEAFARLVPKELMDYLLKHQDTIAPELREVWAANGNKTSGTWEEVFGPGKPAAVTLWGPDLTDEKKNVLWRQLSWPADEFFMAWHYARYIDYVTAAGKREYDIPMYANAWLQQPGCPRPGEYPSGGPVPQVHDIWRVGAPHIDFLSPDLYLSQFDETCERFTRNGNPLFIPEANTGGQAGGNALTTLLKFNGIGFSPFGIDGFGFRPRTQDTNAVPPPDSFAQTYAILDYLAPAILANQGKGTILFLSSRDDTNTPPQVVTLGDYTLTIGPIVPGGLGRRGGGFGPFGAAPTVTNASPTRFVINTAPGEYVFVGGPMNVTFTPNTPGPQTVRLGSFDESMLVEGRWIPGRRLNGDETDHDRRWPSMRSFGIYRYTVYRRD